MNMQNILSRLSQLDTPKIVAEADPLQSRKGINSVNKTARPGQTDLRNVPAGNRADSKNKFSDSDKARQPADLKKAIKGSLGKHAEPALPEGAHTQHYKPEPEKKPGIGSKIASVAKKVGKAITGPGDDELLDKLAKDSGGKKPTRESTDLSLESLRMLSGIRQTMSECGIETMEGPGMPEPARPASLNVTAGSGDELSGILKDLMGLAGIDKSEGPSDIDPGTDVVVDKPGDAGGEPSMKDMISMMDEPDSEPSEPDSMNDDEQEDEGMIGGGLGGMAGGSAGELAGGAIGTALGGPIGGAVGAVAGDVAGTALGSKAGDKITGEEQGSDFAKEADGKRVGEYDNSPDTQVGPDGITTQGDQNNNLSANKDKIVSRESIAHNLFKEYQKFISENK